MELTWTLPATAEWERIASYIKEEFGMKAVKMFLKDTEAKEKRLLLFPESCAPEPLLKGLPILYRSVSISKYNKMIYYIDDEVIYIVDVWDMRRNPSVLADRILK